MTSDYQGRILHIDPPDHHHTLLIAENGRYLGTADGSTLDLFDAGDDSIVWDGVDDGTFRHVASGRKLASQPISGSRVMLLHESDVPDTGFGVGRGPAELPSKSLATLRAQGWVCLPAILPGDQVDELQRVAGCGRWSERRYDHSIPPLIQSVAVAKASTEPVSLWLIRQYMGTEEIRLAHTPSMAVIGRDDGQRDVQGWHSDFPYLWGITRRVGGERVPTGSGELVLGVQRNYCVTDFSAANGATVFKLGTHRLNEGPPPEWGLGAAYSTPGHRREHGLPYDGEDTDVIEAPAGSIIVYDARTWHRAGVNRTDTRRAAMLQAITPMFIMPFSDTSRTWQQFAASDRFNDLTGLQQREAAALLIHEIVGPAGRHAITIDQSAASSTDGY